MTITGDYGRLAATVNALQKLATVPSQVSRVAAPRLTSQMRRDARAQRDPYGKPYAPHKPATVKRWGPHPILKLSGDGIASLTASPAAGAGIKVTADDHMTFTQAGTPTQVVRAVMPNRPQLPATYTRILDAATAQVLRERLKAAK